MKSQIWLLDPRPSLPTIVSMVEHGFALSEASSTPVMLELRIRACHVHGSFVCKDNRSPQLSRRNPIDAPKFDYARVCLPPSTYAQEKHKIDVRWPAAVRYISEHRLNEVFAGEREDIGIVVQGGLCNTLMRALQCLGACGHLRQDAHPDLRTQCRLSAGAVGGGRLLPGEALGVGGRGGDSPTSSSRRSGRCCRSTKYGWPCTARMCCRQRVSTPASWCWTASRDFSRRNGPRDATRPGRPCPTKSRAAKRDAARGLGKPVPVRPPGFCVGCPERPVFSAIKIAEREIGKTHMTADVGCHIFSTLPPFNLGNTMLGYGLGLASSSGIAANFKRRVISIMGDGGFWHNGLTTGVTSALANGGDSIVIIMKNGYAAATGGQKIPSSADVARRQGESPRIDAVLKSVGVKWLKTIRSYSVDTMRKAIVEASTTPQRGLKVIIADGECQLARQRRIRPQIAKQLSQGKRVVRTRFGIDPDTCTGRSFLHPPVGMPVADHCTEPRSAAAGPGRAREQRLRRLRAVRGGGARRGAVSVVLPGQCDPESNLA
jgi:indolepyruvate ferredoxin oxidoreductase alpha subunit